MHLERRGSGVGVGAGAGVEDTGSEMVVQDTGSEPEEEVLEREVGGLRSLGRLSTSRVFKTSGQGRSNRRRPPPCGCCGIEDGSTCRCSPIWLIYSHRSYLQQGLDSRSGNPSISRRVERSSRLGSEGQAILWTTLRAYRYRQRRQSAYNDGSSTETPPHGGIPGLSPLPPFYPFARWY